MAESWELQDLIRAGWSEDDLKWEGILEEFAAFWLESKDQDAQDAAGRALYLAREFFKPNDPRLGTSLANFGLCLAQNDKESGARLLDEARQVWEQTGPWIETMKASRVARSSMFHLRMELRHRDAFRENWQTKWLQMAEDATARIASAVSDFPHDATAASSAAERWQRERPAMLNDTRKLMAAVLLLLPGVGEPPAS